MKGKDKRNRLCAREREELMSDMALMSLMEFMETYGCTEREYWSAFRRFDTKKLIECLKESLKDAVSYHGSVSEDVYDFTVARFKTRFITLIILDMGYDEEATIYLNGSAVC